MSLADRLRSAILAPRPAPYRPAGGLPWEALYPDGPGSVGLRPKTPGGLVSFTGSGASQLLARANAARVELTIHNAAGATAYIALGPVASSSSYTIALADGATYILEDPDCYQGEVAAVWATGSLEVTERSSGR